VVRVETQYRRYHGEKFERNQDQFDQRIDHGVKFERFGWERKYVKMYRERVD
jgi:hypothetical protein